MEMRRGLDGGGDERKGERSGEPANSFFLTAADRSKEKREVKRTLAVKEKETYTFTSYPPLGESDQTILIR